MANKNQIKIIHSLKNKLKMTDENYRDNLYSYFEVESSKDLTAAQATFYIKKLEEDAVKAGVWKKSVWNYTHLDGREGMASSAQLRKIQAMWAEVSDCKSKKERQKGLRKFLLRIVKVEDLRFLKVRMVKKIVNALSAMKKQKENKLKNSA